MAAGAAESVVEIEVPEGGIEIVHPHQTDDAAAEPHAFGISGRAINGLGGFGELVGLALAVLGGVRRRGFALLVLSVIVAALSEGTSQSEQEDSSGNSKMPQKPRPELKHAPTHKFPDCLACPPPLPPSAGY